MNKIFSYYFIIVSILFVFVAGIAVFLPTFSMSLYGDEWLILWHGWRGALTQNSVIPNYQWNAYGFEILVFHYLSKLVGFNGYWFYGLSFLCRFSTAVMLYWFLKQFKVNNLGSFLASLLFMINPVGIETTDWVRNLDSYLAMNLLLIIVRMIYKSSRLFDFLFITLIFILCILINPIRSHGVVIVSVGLSASLVLFNLFKKVNHQSKINYHVLLTIAFPAIYFLLAKLHIFGLHIGNSIIDNNFNTSDLLGNIFINIANSFFVNFKGHFINYQTLFFIITTLMGIGILLSIKINSILKLVLLILFVSIQSVVLFVLINYLNRYVGFSGFVLVFWLFVASIISFILKQKQIFYILTFCLLCLTGFVIYPQIRQIGFRSDFEHRYLIYSSLILPIILGFITNYIYLKSRILKVAFLFGCIIIISSSGWISWNYLNSHSTFHKQNYCDQVRTQVLKHINRADLLESRKFFLFVSDNSYEEPKLYDCLTFGFMFYMGLNFQIWEENKLPIAIFENEKGVESLLTDGKVTKKYIGYEKKVLKKDLYIFQIDNGLVKQLDLDLIKR